MSDDELGDVFMGSGNSSSSASGGSEAEGEKPGEDGSSESDSESASSSDSESGSSSSSSSTSSELPPGVELIFEDPKELEVDLDSFTDAMRSFGDLETFVGKLQVATLARMVLGWESLDAPVREACAVACGEKLLMPAVSELIRTDLQLARDALDLEVERLTSLVVS